MTETQYESRDARFGYECRRCLKCCHDKVIQLNPYEVARLARNRGVTTTVLRSTSTIDGHGVELARTASGACVFLGEDGCRVHADRPLVCRLYPLGLHFALPVGETFRAVTPHPESAGIVHARGTVGEFLDRQDTAPYFAAAEAYARWASLAVAVLRADGAALAGASLDGERLLDMDAAIRDDGCPGPDDVEVRMALHLAILHRELAAIGETDDGA